jgi:hypothetical protein
MAKKDVAVVDQEKALTEAVVLSSTLTARQDRITEFQNVSDLREVFGDIRPWEEIEPSFLVVAQEVFEDKPAVIAGFRFNESKKFMQQRIIDGKEVLVPGEFTSMLVAAVDENENFIPCGVVDPITGEMPVWVIVNDGGTGINKQLERYATKWDEDINVGARQAPPIAIRKGFRRSDYPYETTNAKGEVTVGEATTWYIA